MIKPDLRMTALLDQVTAFLRDNVHRLIVLTEDDNPVVSVLAAYALVNLTMDSAFLALDSEDDETKLQDAIDTLTKKK